MEIGTLCQTSGGSLVIVMETPKMGQLRRVQIVTCQAVKNGRTHRFSSKDLEVLCE